MKFDAKTLSAAVAKAVAIIDRKATIPVLKLVRLTYAGDRLYLMGTNLDVQVTACAAPLEPDLIAPDIDLLVDAAVLHGALKAAKGPVDLTVEGDRLNLTVFGVKTSLTASAPSDFPVMVVDGKAQHRVVVVEADAFLAALKACNVSTSHEATRYYLNGVQIATHEGGLRLVSTDGHRMTQYPLPTVSGGGDLGDGGVILPNGLVETVLKNMKSKDPNDRVSIYVYPEGKVCISLGADVALGKVIDGTFPPTDRAMPSKNAAAFKITVDAQVGQRLAALSSQFVRVICGQGSGLKTALIEATDGSACFEVPCYEMGPMGALKVQYGFNRKYVMDLLKQAPKADLYLSRKNDEPVFVDYPDRPGVRGALMPARV